MGEFGSEQAKITSVETKAGTLDDKTGEKAHELLESELKAKHDAFFTKVDATNKEFARLKNIKHPKAAEELGKDKAEIKSLLLNVATSGEGILAAKEANPSFMTIRQSTRRLSKITDSIKGNVDFFATMTGADDVYISTDDISIKFWRMADALKDRDPQKEADLVFSMEMILNQLGGAMILIQRAKPGNPTLKAIHEKLRKKIEARFDTFTDLRFKYTKEFEYDTDEKKENMSVDLKQLIGLREGKGGPNGAYGVGFNGLESLFYTARLYVEDNFQGEGGLPSAQESSENARANAVKVGAAIMGIDIKTLANENPVYELMLRTMARQTQRYIDEADSLIEKAKKGHEKVDHG